MSNITITLTADQARGINTLIKTTADFTPKERAFYKRIYTKLFAELIK